MEVVNNLDLEEIQRISNLVFCSLYRETYIEEKKSEKTVLTYTVSIDSNIENANFLTALRLIIKPAIKRLLYSAKKIGKYIKNDAPVGIYIHKENNFIGEKFLTFII